jgi:hypothetical protein
MASAARPSHEHVLVTLLCPKCGKRVAVMDHFPTGNEKPSEITLIDGRTPKTADRLVCTHCFTLFPPKRARFPRHLFPDITPDPALE